MSFIISIRSYEDLLAQFNISIYYANPTNGASLKVANFFEHGNIVCTQ
jgi:hypothetical protein